MLPTIVIFSDLNFVCLHLIEALLAKQCRVIVLTNTTRGWATAVAHLPQDGNLKIQNRTKNFRDEIDYFILVSGFLGETKFEERGDVQDAVNFIEGRRVKSLFVFPHERKTAFEELLAKNETRRLYLGGVYGPKMSFAGDSVVSNFLKDVSTTEKTTIPSQDADIFSLFIGDATGEIIRSLFSYGFSGKSATLAEKTTAYRFLESIQKALPEVFFVQGERPLNAPELKGETFNEPKSKTSGSLKLTINWLRENKPQGAKEVVVQEVSGEETPASVPKPKIIHKKKKRFSFNKKRAVFIGISALAVILISPFIFLLVSLASLKISFDNFLLGKTGVGETFISVSDVTSSASLAVSTVVAKVPVFGVPYVFAADTSMLVREAAVITKRAAVTLKEVKTLFSNVFNDSDYDVIESARLISVNLELLYQDSSFLQGEIERIGGLSKRISSMNIDLDRLRHILLNGQVIAKSLPTLLGAEKTKTYMILFQNSMELRPTGGFIGSFALATFDKGKLSNVEFFDVYTADGQLKGHVEPPAPIKNYLGEANWYLRDSNWDPDFGISSQRAEWFLDKEIDRSVDGVIGIDLEVPEAFLKDTGPVRLADFNQDIDYKNLYEKVQYQVESKFFPGSQNKTNILTSLGQAILEKFKDGKNLPLEKVGKSFYQNLEGRHVQVFLHDMEAAKAISSLGWSGEVTTPNCLSQNCAGILAGLVEANVGVNKANYFVSRTITFNSFVTGKSVENTMTVELKNNAPAALGVSGRYKNYVRVVTNAGSKVKQVGIIEAGGTKTVTPEIQTTSGRYEIGTLVDIAPGAKKMVRFTWTTPVELNFGINGNIIYLIRKQAGIGADPVTLKINPPSGVDFLGKTSYNTNLDKDILTSISW